jgi:hypothetical protein
MSSTIGVESWATDLSTLGAIYPFQGWEFPMAIVGIIFWLGWHFVQSSQETKEINRVKAEFKRENAEKAIDRY